ncbi:hypothetical protein V8C86DRAFT_1706849 [Haematococcus lacustris]
MTDSNRVRVSTTHLSTPSAYARLVKHLLLHATLDQGLVRLGNGFTYRCSLGVSRAADGKVRSCGVFDQRWFQNSATGNSFSAWDTVMGHSGTAGPLQCCLAPCLYAVPRPDIQANAACNSACNSLACQQHFWHWRWACLAPARCWPGLPCLRRGLGATERNSWGRVRSGLHMSLEWLAQGTTQPRPLPPAQQPMTRKKSCPVGCGAVALTGAGLGVCTSTALGMPCDVALHQP